jgi:ketosteroid isomerase-like protein
MPQQTAADEAAIRDVIAHYERSIDTADTQLAGDIWLQTDDVSFIHPRGHERGWGAVRENFFVKTMGERFSRRKLRVRDVAIRVHGDTAWV